MNAVKKMNVFRSLFLLLLFPMAGYGEFWGYEGARDKHLAKVWESTLDDFSDSSYSVGVERLFADFEQNTGKVLEPGARRKVGIKLYTQSGPGLSTPHALVRGVLKALVKRGFHYEEIFLLDANERLLRRCQYLPPLSQRNHANYFENVAVQVLDSGKYFDPKWFYESPLPPPLGSDLLERKRIALSGVQKSRVKVQGNAENRKSFLPKPLVEDVDFWINLPVVVDHPSLGLNGALVNATLLNISNRDRFFSSRTNAPVAAAEIAGIPELLSGWAVTIISLERYQFIGGPAFNSRYTVSEPKVWMSVNPVLLDDLFLEKLNGERKKRDFDPIKPLTFVQYAESIGVGFGYSSRIDWIRVP